MQLSIFKIKKQYVLNLFAVEMRTISKHKSEYVITLSEFHAAIKKTDYLHVK